MQRQMTQIDGADLPPGIFLSIVGSYSHLSSVPMHNAPMDGSHVYLWVLQPRTGLIYECAVHTRLTYESNMRVCVFKELLEVEKWPDFGIYITGQSLSYQDLGLAPGDFSEVERRSLNDELSGFAIRADRIQVYGFACPGGNGIHDIHQNSGEPPHMTRSNRPGEDGALLFYYSAKPGLPAHRLWLCLKFEEQASGT